jgi:hypothetical protein
MQEMPTNAVVNDHVPPDRSQSAQCPKSTGPTTPAGKNRSRRNAIRHGLSAETVVTAIEDIEYYQDFEKAVIADYDARTIVERDLVLRVASLLWRLRRATAIETGLLQTNAEFLLEKNQMSQLPFIGEGLASRSQSCSQDEISRCFSRLANSDGNALAGARRYEAALWRQLRQTIFTLRILSRRQREVPPARSKRAWWGSMEASSF